mmetsp:Transcript_42462/g.83456  ORF Transcript_42462/g.83456 Transcript_42462/m.83456 type:complete len:188 (-) Transcript_42462:165-728(-)
MLPGGHPGRRKRYRRLRGIVNKRNVRRGSLVNSHYFARTYRTGLLIPPRAGRRHAERDWRRRKRSDMPLSVQDSSRGSIRDPERRGRRQSRNKIWRLCRRRSRSWSWLVVRLRVRMIDALLNIVMLMLMLRLRMRHMSPGGRRRRFPKTMAVPAHPLLNNTKRDSLSFYVHLISRWSIVGWIQDNKY